MIVNIEDDILILHNQKLLEKLLVDKTTKKNIMWASDAYSDHGSDYLRNEEIKAHLITGPNSDIIKTRARKDMEQQFERTRQRAEVFTPLWICERMNNDAERFWFEDNITVEDEKEPDYFSYISKNDKSFKKYIDSKRLEITCGEAPYLVSRYDMATGEVIPVEKRIGLLDRKLQAIGKYAQTEDKWMYWVIRAYQSIFGYEFQGDNVLIARVNLLMTFDEYMLDRWNRKPTPKEKEKIANIIAWNIWQMDGLTYTTPYSEAEERYKQLDLFGLLKDEDNQESGLEEIEKNTQPYCRIYDWHNKKKSIEFKELKEGMHMKFDFIIGNPPYQEESDIEVTTNGQKPRKNIFHHFQQQVDELVSLESVLIYPAGRWIHQSGKGLKQFGINQINDKHLKKIVFFPNSKEVFPTTDIPDGISIVMKNQIKDTPGFEYVYCEKGEKLSIHMDNPGTSLIPLNPKDAIIAKKIDAFVNDTGIMYLHDAVLPRSLFGIESDFIERNPHKACELKDDTIFDESKKIKVLTNDKAGAAGRSKWFVIDRDLIKSNSKYIDEWQVVVSSAHPGGQDGRDNQLEIIDNHSAFGRARVALRSFNTREEAHNFYSYVSSRVIKYAFLLTDEALSSLAKRVPDIIDYSSGNPIIDFSTNIDLQLQSLIDLTEEEMNYIENKVKEKK